MKQTCRFCESRKVSEIYTDIIPENGTDNPMYSGKLIEVELFDCEGGCGENAQIVKCQSDFHTKCHDCGQFLKRELWVGKDHSWKKHALCSSCYSGYDDPMCL